MTEPLPEPIENPFKPSPERRKQLEDRRQQIRDRYPQNRQGQRAADRRLKKEGL